jgi:MFS family permease
MGFAIVLLYAVSAVASGGLGLSPQAIGIILSVGSIGALVAAVTANRIGKALGVGRTIVISIFLGAPPALVIALMPPDLAVPLGAAALFVLTFSGVVYNINQVSFRQAITPGPMQGRMNATMRFIVWGTIPIANMIGGFLGGAIGLQQTLLVSGVLSFIPVLPVLFSPVRTIREMPAPMTDEQESQIIGEALDETIRPSPSPKARLEDDLEAGG